MKMLCGFYKHKKASNSNKRDQEPEKQLPSSFRVASTVITQKSPKPGLDITKLECFRNNETILQNFEILEKIGAGSFGEIYKVRCFYSDKIQAMKIEKKRPAKNLLLLKEKQILMDFQKEFGFPHISSFIKGDPYSYLMMTNLGDNLETLKKKMNNKFSIKTVLMIGYQILERIEILHKKNYLHRDIKPENFVIGSGENYKTIYLIDFGLSKTYMENNKHITYTDNKGMVGTARYASINTHVGIEQSRRDDLEAIGYILVYFAKGRLPWQNIYAKNKEQKYSQIMNSKQKSTLEVLCNGLPEEFILYFKYVKALEFIAKPDYNYLKQLFLTMMKKYKYKMDFEFDWISLFASNSNNYSSLEIKTDENQIKNTKNPHNMDHINFETTNKLSMKKNLDNSPKLLKPSNLSPINNDDKIISSLTSSNKNNEDCDLKEEDYDQVKIQETYFTSPAKLIRSSLKKKTKKNHEYPLTFRGKILFLYYFLTFLFLYF